MTAEQGGLNQPPLTRRELRERERAAAAAAAGGQSQEQETEQNVEASAPAESVAPQNATATESVVVPTAAPAESASGSRRAGTASPTQAGAIPDLTTSHAPVSEEPAAPTSFDALISSDAPADTESSVESVFRPSASAPGPVTSPVSLAAPQQAEPTTQTSAIATDEGKPTLTRRELRAMLQAQGANEQLTQPEEAPVSENANTVEAPVAPSQDSSTAPETVPAPVDVPVADGEPRSFQPPTGHWSIAAAEPESAENVVTTDTGMSRSVVASGSVTTTNALILPNIPSLADAPATLNATGEILVTGSIDLPRSLGATGQQQAGRFDAADIDHMFEQAEREHDTDEATPVKASNAVSTRDSGKVVVTPPKNRSTRLLPILVVTAGVLALGVVGLLVAGFVFRVL